MEITTTRIYEDNAQAWLSGKRRALNEGGTYSSKTWSILQILILIAQNAEVPTLISIVSESLPHLKRGAIRDFFRILGESQDNNPRYNKTEHVYNFGVGHIEFFGADEAAILGMTKAASVEEALAAAGLHPGRQGIYRVLDAGNVSVLVGAGGI